MSNNAFNTPLSVDVGIVITLKEEFSEFYNEIKKKKCKPIKDMETGRYYYLFEYPNANTQHTYQCVTCFVGDMGSMKAGLTTQRFLSQWKPRTLVMLGIAAGLSKDVRIGDVVIASQVDAYLENSKAVPTAASGGYAFRFSGEVYRSSSDLLHMVQNFEFVHQDINQDWQAICAGEFRRLVSFESLEKLITRKLLGERVQMIEGHLASGPTVAASQDFTEWLKTRDRKYLALEMEAAGLMAAVYEEADPKRILILRAISDYGDERKGDLDEIGGGALRRYAMHNAIQLLWKLFDAEIFLNDESDAPSIKRPITVVPISGERGSTDFSPIWMRKTMELSDSQHLYLQTIFDYLHEHGKWPTYKHVDRKLTQIRRDLDIEKISKSLPSGFATAFAFNRDLNAPAILNIFAIYECTGSEEDLADFVKAVHYGVERYFGAREDETTIVIMSDELKEQLSLSELALRRVGLLIRDASEYRIYESFGSREEDSWWSWTLSREIRYFDGVTSIEEYLARIDQLTKPSQTQSQRSGMRAQINDRGARKSFSTSAALDAFLFEGFTRELLQGLGFTGIIEPEKPDAGYDFRANYPFDSPSGIPTQQVWIVEAKYGKPGRQTTLDALHRLVAYTKFMKADKALLVTNTALTSVAREYITQLDAEVKSKLEVWDGEQLLLLQRQFPNLGQKYSKIIATFPSSTSKPFTTRQQYFIEELAKCQPGQHDCHKYEDVCVAILTEVFVPPLKKPQIQPRTLNGLERRDALFSLRGVKQGWEEVRQEFDANFLLCEFKNYTESFSKEEVNQTRNYLRDTIGRLGIVFSRIGASESAMRMRNSIYSQENKVILFLEDKHLIELLKMKETHQSPLDLIQEAIDQFYISHE